MDKFDVSRYQPKKVGDIIFGNADSADTIAEFTSGVRTLPTFSKNGILLYGMWGTGKTTLARLLPKALENAVTGAEEVEATYIQCQYASEGQHAMSKIQRISPLVSPNASSKHYFVLDEVDTFTGATLSTLRSIMTEYVNNTIFILTTNHIDRLEPGLRSRCIQIAMDAAAPEQWLPFARRLLLDCDVSGVSDAQLLKVIEPCRGNARDIGDAVVTIAVRRKRRATSDGIPTDPAPLAVRT